MIIRWFNKETLEIEQYTFKKVKQISSLKAMKLQMSKKLNDDVPIPAYVSGHYLKSHYEKTRQETSSDIHRESIFIWKYKGKTFCLLTTHITPDDMSKMKNCFYILWDA